MMFSGIFHLPAYSYVHDSLEISEFEAYSVGLANAESTNIITGQSVLPCGIPNHQLLYLSHNVGLWFDSSAVWNFLVFSVSL